jgi:serine/threonine protein kinase
MSSKEVMTERSSQVELIQQYIPILCSLLEQINPIHAHAWSLQLVGHGIVDGNFPADISIIRKAFKEFGIPITDLQLHHFDNLQGHFFSLPVLNGEHQKYAGKSSPYMNEYTPGFPICGTFGEVDKVVLYRDKSAVFARKRLLRVDQQDQRRLEQEIKILQKFQHPHSIKFYGSYEYQREFFLIFDFADMNLHQFLRTPPSWFLQLRDEEKASKILNWMIDMASAIAEFHALGGIHRDLKPQNILLRRQHLLIADFGLACVNPTVTSNVQSVHGTELYMAPEQGYGKKYGPTVDVFALGCVYLELLTFGENLSLEYFAKFRKHFGPHSCLYNGSSCFRHNLESVAHFVDKHLRGNPVTDDLLDIIQFDMLGHSPQARIPARHIRAKMIKQTNSLPFFVKESCCDGTIDKVKMQSASMSSLLNRMGSLEVTLESEKMEVELGEIGGHFERGVFGR